MKNTLVIDLDRCSGCDSCVAACKMENQMNLGRGAQPRVGRGPCGYLPRYRDVLAAHAVSAVREPRLHRGVPHRRSYRDEETGIVLVNAEDCIGCESCLTGCPYGVRQLNPKTNTIEKVHVVLPAQKRRELGAGLRA